jgi:hypothetical protein
VSMGDAPFSVRWKAFWPSLVVKCIFRITIGEGRLWCCSRGGVGRFVAVCTPLLTKEDHCVVGV